ncbi:Putative peroxiredoxin bcp [Phycisphaerales bacterium]|nr:Putative peroxiredoxin bcp [Phycisphaerales bacterium]
MVCEQSRVHDPSVLPPGLPAPLDDGACMHLRGRPLPDLELPSTGECPVRLSDIAAGRSAAVLFFFPRTSIPGQPPSLGFHGEEWDSVPGARGCTPQSCGFRDLHAEFRALQVCVYGVSTSTTEHQREFRSRQHVPFEFLSDHELRLTSALDLPTFRFPIESGGPNVLLHRMAWLCESTPARDHGAVTRIRRVWYPVFPPNENATRVLEVLREREGLGVRAASPRDSAFVSKLLAANYSGEVLHSRGRARDAGTLPALVASVHDRHVGIAVFDESSADIEVLALAACERGDAAASMLLDAVEDRARLQGRRRVVMTLANSALDALAFAQRRGYAISQVRRGMFDWYRTAHAAIPRVDSNGVPIRDEIELELALD